MNLAWPDFIVTGSGTELLETLPNYITLTIFKPSTIFLKKVFR